MTKYVLITILTLLVLAAPSFAQGEFLRPGENAIGFAGIKTFGDDAAGLGGSLGVGINGCLDIAVAFSHNSDLGINTFSPSLTYYFKENKPKSVVGLGLTAGYAHSETSGGRTVGGDALLGA
ncbi:MAG: hypothetical protein JSV52_11635 [Candidatus Zixiibacteriota bacterium]|nr:MAG: hypothetical protein JSV52_11635 [candidate division Zixibacteria bacterium]